MKLELKKLALIMAAGIFAVSGLVAAMDEPNESTAGQDMKFKNIKVVNELKGRTVEIKLNKDKVAAAKQFIVEKASNKVEEIPGGNLEALDISIGKATGGMKGEITVAAGEIKVDLARERGRRAIANRIRDRVKQELKDRGITITAEPEGDTLVITVKKVAGMTPEEDKM